MVISQIETLFSERELKCAGLNDQSRDTDILLIQGELKRDRLLAQ